MPALKKNHIPVTDEEDAAITAAAMSDPDAIPFTDEEFEAARPTLRKGGRPPKDVRKVPVTIRLDADVVEALKSGGKGWQTRLNDMVREHLKKDKKSFGRYVVRESTNGRMTAINNDSSAASGTAKGKRRQSKLRDAS